MATWIVQLKIDAESLAVRVSAMAEYLDALDRDAPTPFGRLAMEIGEIDLMTSTRLIKVAGGFALEPTGALARLLEAFEAERGVAA